VVPLVRTFASRSKDTSRIPCADVHRSRAVTAIEPAVRRRGDACALQARNTEAAAYGSTAWFVRIVPGVASATAEATEESTTSRPGSEYTWRGAASIAAATSRKTPPR